MLFSQSFVKKKNTVGEKRRGIHFTFSWIFQVILSLSPTGADMNLEYMSKLVSADQTLWLTTIIGPA